MKTRFLLLAAMIIAFSLSGQTNYQNDKYGFSVKVPDNWKIYAEFKDDPSLKRAIIDWKLPQVYSELEKGYVENAISISAFRRTDIKNIDDLINYTLDRISQILVSKEPLRKTLYTSCNFITKRNGFIYKSKVAFVFKNNTAYVLNYTSTPGTYDINLHLFDSLIKNVQFFEPKESQDKTVINAIIQINGLYVAKTGEVNIQNTKSDIYTYIRFYKDGTVYKQSVNSYEPEKVSVWFGKNGRFESKGDYKIEGADINFALINEGSSDVQHEGVKSDMYTGKITDQNKLYLEVKYANGESSDFWFEFVRAD